MTREEATKIAYDMGAHPYSINGMIDCLLKGEEIGKGEQKAVDIDKAKIAYCSACATGLANSKVCRECPCVEFKKFTQLLKEE